MSCIIGALALATASVEAHAQDLEPRAYANTPVGLNFLIGGYAYTEGTVSTDPSIPLAGCGNRRCEPRSSLPVGVVGRWQGACREALLAGCGRRVGFGRPFMRLPPTVSACGSGCRRQGRR